MQFFANQNSLRRVVRFDKNVWESGFRMFLLGRNLLLLMMRRILLRLLYPLPFPIHLHLHLHLQLHLLMLMLVPQVHQLLHQNTGKHSLFSICKKRISFPPRLSSPRKTPSSNNNNNKKEKEGELLLLPPPLFVSSPKSSIVIYLAREQESKEVRVLFQGKVW